MKKIYMIPTTKLVNIHTTQMIALSIAVGNEYKGETVLSRRGRNDFWDDDEEDYE